MSEYDVSSPMKIRETLPPVLRNCCEHLRYLPEHISQKEEVPGVYDLYDDIPTRSVSYPKNRAFCASSGKFCELKILGISEDGSLLGRCDWNHTIVLLSKIEKMNLPSGIDKSEWEKLLKK